MSELGIFGPSEGPDPPEVIIFMRAPRLDGALPYVERYQRLIGEDKDPDEAFQLVMEQIEKEIDYLSGK